jgi:type II secretory pathway pseudopilin PulG
MRKSGFLFHPALAVPVRRMFRRVPDVLTSDRAEVFGADFAATPKSIEGQHGSNGLKDAARATEMRRRAMAFTLAEVIVAVTVGLLALGIFYTSASKAIQLVRSGKQTADASQLLQMRLETIRLTSPWANITTAAGLQSIITTAAPSAANFPGVTETYLVTPYPSGTGSLTVTRSPSGTMSSRGSDLSAQKCVQVEATLTWKGINSASKQCQLVTILTKGGL